MAPRSPRRRATSTAAATIRPVRRERDRREDRRRRSARGPLLVGDRTNEIVFPAKIVSHQRRLLADDALGAPIAVAETGGRIRRPSRPDRRRSPRRTRGRRPGRKCRSASVKDRCVRDRPTDRRGLWWPRRCVRARCRAAREAAADSDRTPPARSWTRGPPQEPVQAKTVRVRPKTPVRGRDASAFLTDDYDSVITG